MNNDAQDERIIGFLKMNRETGFSVTLQSSVRNRLLQYEPLRRGEIAVGISDGILEQLLKDLDLDIR